ncbi:unnamed protein product (macronuclear) [Paramecium tetraurelia]|uniref:P-type ATPase A domain-containing protein n=1 Tax=Paramecium tetraurelia TaxID=5888 RepID=A0C0Y0_PARTE|nr:uncharacterized protein GSPATT00033923001 [Paramecium tetraurelia]CAK64447.1 unnamed protein product [Paramecium tetraurelia]|eukprot:XP_001431845.1 hypothetical protein (macronuclear) [Paramecium tetraurelia strain d4-2]
MDPSSLLSKAQNPVVVDSEIEGTTKITYIEPIRLQKRRVVLGVLLSVITSFLFTLACSWSKKLVRKFFFKESQMEMATHMWIINNDNSNNISKLMNKQNEIYFINRKLNYIYNTSMNAFKALEYDLKTKRELLQAPGIQQPILFQEKYGKCLIDIPKPNLFVYLLKELTAPFYILQYLSCFLWVLEDLAILSIIMISVSLIFTTINFLLLQNSAKKLRNMAKSLAQVQVYRGLQPCNQQAIQFRKIDSKDLVPGDVIAIENKMTLPCDCVLVSGDLLMNEASLTGESIPIPKIPVEDLDQPVSFMTDKRHCLYEGTKVLLARPKYQHVVAIVGRTGFSSFKGQIFRSVLYPKVQPFAFYSQGIKYLICLAICVLIVYFALLHRMITVGFSFMIIFLRFWDALTWIVPPALPIFVSMCQTYSLIRLRQKGIFGIDPTKSLVSGKINTVCFDKTGTLTTIGIDMFGYQLRNQQKFAKFILKNQVKSKNSLEFKLFATCNGTYEIEGDLMGDSLDVELFKFTDFKIDKNPPQNAKSRVVNREGIVLDVLKLYEFESALQRMSVIVKDTDDYYVFVKGSPEKMAELSMQNTIPTDFKKNLNVLTMKGLRILGFGYKQITQEECERLMNASRQECESDIQFLGLLAMENKLKHDTPQVINLLNNACVDLKIISGDNPLTTVQCARECGIIPLGKPVLLLDYNEKEQQLSLDEIGVFEDNLNNNQSKLNSEIDILFDEVEDVNESSLDHQQIMNKLVQHLLTAQNIKRSIISENDNLSAGHCFAMSGKAFDYFWDQLPHEEIKKHKRQSFAGFEQPIDNVEQIKIQGLTDEELHNKLFASICLKAKVFARMRPEQKSMVIEKLQQLNKMVLMIGDGANDCAAIKQANVGVSFAQSDAAFSAPYSSADDSIDCVRQVLLDGRCALQNALEVFQYYVGASVIKYIAAMINMSFGQNFADLQYIAINYIGSLPYLKSISLSKPSILLTKDLPNESMMAISNAAVLSFQIIVASFGLIINFLYWNSFEWDNEPSVVNGKFSKEGTIQTTLFKSIQIYFIMAVIAIYTSRPFKQKLVTHKIMLIFICISLSFTLWIFFTYQEWQYTVFKLYNTNTQHGRSYNFIQFLLTIIVGLVMLIGDEYFIKRVFPNNQNQIKKSRVRPSMQSYVS